MQEAIANFNWWQASFLALGAIAAVSIFASIFIKSETLTENFFSPNSAEIGSDDFFYAIAGMTGDTISRGGNVSLLNNGDEFMPAVLKDINEAKSSINLTNYIWKSGEMSDALLDALILKAKKGVEVRILLDTLGAKNAPLDKTNELRDAGGQVKYFRTPKFGRLMRFHKRNHRRSIVIDGKIGYTGGIAIDDKWLGNADEKDKWRDTMIRTTGILTSGIQAGFVQLWTSTTGEILAGQKFYPSLDASGETISINILSSPAEDTQPLPGFIWYSIQSAKKSIYITNPYFLPPKSILDALIEAKKRGVEVQILLPSELTDAKHVRMASRSNYSPLLKEGVRIFEYQASRLHAKHIVIDEEWSLVGSANMDNRSLVLNQENVLAIYDKEFGQTMVQTFKNDLEKAVEIKSDNWEKRSIFLKALETLSSSFEKQY